MTCVHVQPAAPTPKTASTSRVRPISSKAFHYTSRQPRRNGSPTTTLLVDRSNVSGARATIRKLLCLCFWNLLFFWNTLPTRVEQSFERDLSDSCQKRRAVGTIPIGLEKYRRRAPLLETPPAKSAKKSVGASETPVEKESREHQYYQEQAPRDASLDVVEVKPKRSPRPPARRAAGTTTRVGQERRCRVPLTELPQAESSTESACTRASAKGR